MVKKVTVALVDDIDGKPASKTVRFSLENHYYEIDLSEENYKAIAQDFEKWVRHARKATSGGSRRTHSLVQQRDPKDIKAIRRWAKENKITLPARGRLPQTVIDQYAAHKASKGKS